jgi:heat shock protein HtpX
MGEEESSSTQKISFADIVKKVSSAGTLNIELDQKKIYGWFAAVIFGLLVSYWFFFAKVVHVRNGVSFTLTIIAIAAIAPFALIYVSKWIAIKTHKITIIAKNNYRNPEEEALYTLTESICKRAGMGKVPAIGIYESKDMNAFATGRNKDDALVAVSTGLMQGMDEKAISAVVAHEVAHIANGDMLTLALIQAAVTVAVMIVAVPIWVINLFAKFYAANDRTANGYLVSQIINVITWIITFLLSSLGLLAVRFYSRKREYEADALSADLVDRNYMIDALKFLQNDTEEAPKAQLLYSAFKTNAPQFFMEFLSSHPPIEKRIQALSERA